MPDDTELKVKEKELRAKRGNIKGRLTLFSSYLENLSDDASLTPAEIRELQLRLNKTEGLFDQFNEVQSSLEYMYENVDSLTEDRIEFEDRYYKLISQAQTLIRSYDKKESDFGSAESASTTKPIMRKNIKLPPIELPKFSGSYDTWLEFRDTFISMVHTDSEYDDISKFHYLRFSLEGSAAEIIKKIEFSAENYSVAWKSLCERYDNQRLLTNNHVSALFNVEKITKESSHALKNMIDQFNKNLRALKSLKEPVDQWDTLLIYLGTQKFDTITYRKWEEYKSQLDKNKSISFEIFISFIQKRADFLETLELSHNKPSTSSQINKSITKPKHANKTLIALPNANKNNKNSLVKTCPHCQSDQHTLVNCSQFLSLSNESRLKLLPTFKICYNCFQAGHYASRCNKPGCKLCKRRHHTLVHVTNAENNNSSNRTESANVQSNTSSLNVNAGTPTAPVVSHSNNVSLSASVTTSNHIMEGGLLSTALIKVSDSEGREHIARVVLDCGSTSCLMSEHMHQVLNLPAVPVNKSVQGINKSELHVNKMCLVKISSLNENYSTKIQCCVIPSISDDVPCSPIDLSDLNIPTDLCLADPKFYSPAPVDFIIGVSDFWDMIGAQRIRLGEGKPRLIETSLGWILGGKFDDKLDLPIKCNFTKTDNIDTQLTRFWELEEVRPVLTDHSPEEKLCEEHFIKNTTRLDDGSFCVKIPLKEDPSVLGNSSQRAKRCFTSLERRLVGKYGELYRDFMSEYESLGHMSEIPESQSRSDAHFISHLGVLRESSITTLLRVVYHASYPTSSGISLNEIQMVGPTVQDDLLSILLRFRSHKYVLSADVAKMYRTVMVHPSDRYLQQIYWRHDPSETIKIYQLNTVTYGTASAPFLATRCLKQIGLECTDKQISDIIIHDFYVDDLLTGSDDLDNLKSIREKVTNELSAACMHLRKWKSNDPQIASESTNSPIDLNIGSSKPSKVLGLGWDSNSDEITFPFSTDTLIKNTKRNMLSVISQIFDPLGLLSPYIIRMKMLLQRLWLLKLSWDDELPLDVSQEWTEVMSNIPKLSDLRIPRVVLCDSYKYVDLHVFVDASERAYGTCLYVRSGSDDGDVLVRLLTAKSRVAPLKPTTIPRLELCGALAGARLYDKVAHSLRTPIRSTTFWCDSTIVLGWLKMLPNKLQPFVRNRVGEILELTGDCVWRHVPTAENPADYVSRGKPVEVITSLELYWNGPMFLQHDESTWPSNPVIESTLPEIRKEVTLHTSSTQNSDTVKFIDFDRFSNYLRLVRSIAYMLRFIGVCKKQPAAAKYLTKDDLSAALKLIIVTSQRESFPEYKMLIEKRNLPKKSPLIKFNVFLDDDKIMRVGGRLSNSNFSYEKKFPILLQSTHRFTKLLFHYEHLKLLHAGPQLLLSTIRENYWPIGGRNLAKTCYRRCVQCTRVKGKIVAPMMGNLPQQRLVPGGYPFETAVGVDYAGPMSCVSRQGRGSRVVKAYIAIFICFTTKAVHLELVGDLSSNNFLLALGRFTSRRGNPNDIYSDNGTSFVGACNELSKFLKANCDSLSQSVANDSISFHFIPAYSPHFGGLWEAGVKSTKMHLQRVLGNCHLTYEELNTTLVQIEAVLNSRPLTPLSSEPDDFSPLTPGHFLVGRPLTSLPVRDLHDRSIHSLNRYQRIEQLRQHFWTRWSSEYVTELQRRTKWTSDNEPLKINTLVLIKEEHLPPLKWKLGRIVAVVPGADGINRVADIRTATGVVRRSFSKICPLPVIADSDSC